MLDIPYVTHNDLERWELAISKALPVLKKSIQDGKTQQGRRYYQLFREYRSLASVYYCKGDIIACRKALKSSADAYKDLLVKYGEGELIKPGFISYVDYQPMLLALIVGDQQLAVELANLYGQSMPNPNESEFFINLGLAIKFTITGELNKAEEHIDKAVAKGFKGVNSFAAMLKSVISDSGYSLNAFWQQALAEFDSTIKSESVGTPEAAIFLDGLGLIALNALKNKQFFEPSVPDIRVNTELLIKV